MLIEGIATRSIRLDGEGQAIEVLDQRLLPFKIHWVRLSCVEEVEKAIKDMVLRGAPLIGAVAAYGVYFAYQESLIQGGAEGFARKVALLRKARPTAVNLAWAIDQQLEVLASHTDPSAGAQALWKKAQDIVEDDIKACEAIGVHGLPLIEGIWQEKKRPVNILTHCNAGWLACLDWGTATAPLYKAQVQDIPLHVWVDETRPRNQGMKLTSFELLQQGIPHTVITDNAGGHLMQKGLVDLVIVGSDRTTLSGDVANKVGTYLKALAAYDNGVPFYVALPQSSFDPHLELKAEAIPIEERSPDEVTHIDGLYRDEHLTVAIAPKGAKACNIGFDITPSRLVTGLITERGVLKADRPSILAAFPEFQE